MVKVEDLDGLLVTASQGDIPALRSLTARLAGRRSEALAESAAGALAPQLCRSLTRDLRETGSVPDEDIEAVLTGLARQRSLLAILDSTDELLASADFIRLLGARLSVTFLSAHGAALVDRPLAAAAFAEGALRLATVGVGNALRTALLLTPDRLEVLDSDYLERLPRLVGAALDVWNGEALVATPLRTTLGLLAQAPSTAADAAFEQGLDSLRQAVTGTRLTALRLLGEARRRFAHAEAAEEVRHDAAVYGAGVDAIMAFVRDDRSGLAVAQRRLEENLAVRMSWLERTYIPDWRRPRLGAAVAWSRLVAILELARHASTQPLWLNTWPAVDAVLDAYVLDRALVPVPGVLDPGGLAQVVRPTLENSLVRREILLAQIRRAADELLSASEPAARSGQLLSLRDRLDQLMTPGERPDDVGRESTDGVALERMILLAPSLTAELGTTAASGIAARLDDDCLRLVEGLAYNGAVRQAATRTPVAARLLERLSADLRHCPDYAGAVRQQFDGLLFETIAFIATRHDVKGSAGVSYLRPMEPPPGERALQDDYADWLRRGRFAGRVEVEVVNVATGRADVKVGSGSAAFFVEVKRELRDASNETMERSYLAQAADYAGTNVTLGILLVLDLTPHPTGVRHLSECAWVARSRPQGSGCDRYVVVAVVIGNRNPPSSYSA